MTVNIFVDVEATGASPIRGLMTEFGAVTENKRSFYGRLYESTPDPKIPAIPVPGRRLAEDVVVARQFDTWIKQQCSGGRPVFVSDNPAFDFMWIAALFDNAAISNPFGHSGRRISDFWAGLNHDWSQTQQWKKFRVTPHTHNPVDDAMGNVEAFHKLMDIAEAQRGE